MKLKINIDELELIVSSVVALQGAAGVVLP